MATPYCFFSSTTIVNLVRTAHPTFTHIQNTGSLKTIVLAFRLPV
ncbi:hypothetical protein [Alysiella crassa]|nr:hypothetical protein [Alysiella crassa]